MTKQIFNDLFLIYVGKIGQYLSRKDVMQTWQIHKNRKCIQMVYRDLIFNKLYLNIRNQSLNYDTHLVTCLKIYVGIQYRTFASNTITGNANANPLQLSQKRDGVEFYSQSRREEHAVDAYKTLCNRRADYRKQRPDPGTGNSSKLSSTVLTRLIIQHKLAKTDLAHSVCSTHAHTQ